MKLTCLQENLAKGLNIVSRVVAPRMAALPVLTHVLLATDNGRLKIAATNLELGITCWVGAKVDRDGAITVPARALSELVALLPQEKVELELNVRTQSLSVKSGKTSDLIKGIDAQEFPIIPTFNENAAAYIAPDELRRLISHVVFCASTDESAPMLTGVLTRIEGDTITMVGSDRFRLSVKSARLSEPVAQPLRMLIPAKALAEVARALNEQTDPVAICVSATHGQVLFHLTSVDVVAQLIDHNFLDYERILPRSHATRAVTQTADLLRACRRASIYARDVNDRMQLQIRPGTVIDNPDEPESEIETSHGIIAVTAHAEDTGDNLSDIEALISGEGMDIGFNVRYVIDVLSAIDAPQVIIETASPRSAVAFRLVGDDSFLHIIMPLNRA